ncbi:MAG: hypothetical protein LQ338_002379 [Usnochroma carphineum]|nr:MAG: hypothetical protein LQ338_002379 [Usnochroma carphineum]
MDLMGHLEELAVLEATRPDQELTPEEISRWCTLFGYSASEAPDIIVRFQADINRPKLSDEQWNSVRAAKEAEGYHRETYEHQIQLWLRRQRESTKCDDESLFIFKLGGRLNDIESLQREVGVSAKVPRGHEEEGHADFACINGAAKRAIEEWFKTQSSTFDRPIFIHISQAPKDLSEISCHPTLGIDSSLPQHRMLNINHTFAPTQMEYPVWYFFYGTLMDQETLQKCLSLPHFPQLISASIKGGVLRTWGHKYKALVDGPADARVHGYGYRVESSEHEGCLRIRESAAYEVVRCRITLDSEEVQGLTFRFAKHELLDMD